MFNVNQFGVMMPFFMSVCAALLVQFVPVVFVHAAEASAPETIRLSKNRNLADDPTVKQWIKNAMGTDEHLYYDSSQLTSEPKVDGDDIIVTSGMRGLFTITETFLVVNPPKKIAYVGVMEDGKAMKIYGPATSRTELPKLAQNYLSDLQKRSGTTQQLAFRKAAIAGKAKPVAKPEVLTYKSMTGKYERPGKFTGGLLVLKQLPNDKVQFALSAANGANSGQAAGTVPVKGNQATYSGPGFKLNFTFAPKQVVINGTGAGFGGFGVTPNGAYTKVSEKISQVDFEQP